MATTITAQQKDDLRQHGNKPVPVVDPDTSEVYFLVSQSMFEKFRSLFADDAFDIRETYAAQDAALAKVWDDPALDVYNEYGSSKSRP